MQDKLYTTEAINNLRHMSEALSQIANDPKWYNTQYGHYLEQMSHQLYCDANDLIEITSHFCL
jgi:hypothetical protein